MSSRRGVAGTLPSCGDARGRLSFVITTSCAPPGRTHGEFSEAVGWGGTHDVAEICQQTSFWCVGALPRRCASTAADRGLVTRVSSGVCPRVRILSTEGCRFWRLHGYLI